MAYEAIIEHEGVYRVILEKYTEGVYVFVFEKPDSTFPEQDHLQDDLEMAMHSCEQDYGIPRNMWREIPDPHLSG